jgi:hypothetical protein
MYELLNYSDELKRPSALCFSDIDESIEFCNSYHEHFN